MKLELGERMKLWNNLFYGFFTRSQHYAPRFSNTVYSMTSKRLLHPGLSALDHYCVTVRDAGISDWGER
jgi:hypothetical protein